MPLVAHNQLPTFERLRSEGIGVLSPHRAAEQDIRELHVGLLNMMPDAALAATERQFFRLVANSNQIAQFYLHPFSLPELERGAQAAAHIADYYETFEQVQAQGLDALIITGANVVGHELSNQAFWEPLKTIVDWAYDNVSSTLCSCLATHAVMEFRYDCKRQPLGCKRWGVFEHNVLRRDHPLVDDVNTRFDVPHSRYNAISSAQFRDAGVHVLVRSEVAGPHLAVSEDGFRIVMFQGHPEYDTVSLLKEYKREVGRYAAGDRPDYPPFPDNYLNPTAEAVLDEFRHELESRLAAGHDLPQFPEPLLLPTLDNTWHDTAESILGNWIGRVYALTGTDRKQLFMAGIDPANPLGL